MADVDVEGETVEQVEALLRALADRAGAEYPATLALVFAGAARNSELAQFHQPRSTCRANPRKLCVSGSMGRGVQRSRR